MIQFSLSTPRQCLHQLIKNQFQFKFNNSSPGCVSVAALASVSQPPPLINEVVRNVQWGSKISRTFHYPHSLLFSFLYSVQTGGGVREGGWQART